MLQEGIDLAVILNSLRALRTDRSATTPLSHSTEELLRRFSAEHDRMRDDLTILRDTAQLVSAGDRDGALATLQAADGFRSSTLLPHEDAEDSALYPALARPLGSAEATVTMSRMHAEIHRLSERLHSHREIAEEAGAVTRSSPTTCSPVCTGCTHALLRAGGGELLCARSRRRRWPTGEPRLAHPQRAGALGGVFPAGRRQRTLYPLLPIYLTAVLGARRRWSVRSRARRRVRRR